jgi:hypothetical protein
MTHYYFDIVEPVRRTPDGEGIELADEAAAQAHAASLLLEVARDIVLDGDFPALAVEARDEAGRPAFRASLQLHFSDQSSGGADPG